MHHKDTRSTEGNPYAHLVPGGRLLIFGRPTLNWDGAPSAEDYYKSFGFSEVHTLDVSAYEGATHIYDLNAPQVPEELCGRYRAVLSGGTIEHVFNIVNALKIAASSLEIGGSFFCGAPCNNWIDHGFWQISPTLKFDYFSANSFEMGTSVCTLMSHDRNIKRYLPLFPAEGRRFDYAQARTSHMLEVIKTEKSTLDIVPLQSLYLKKHSDAHRNWRFRPMIPFDIIGDERHDAPLRWFDLSSGSFQASLNGCKIRFRVEGILPSAPPLRPFRSSAIVFEDGRMLDWIVSGADMIADRNGSFAHIGNFIYFSSTDGSDPRENGRQYQVAFPQPALRMQPYRPDELYQPTNKGINVSSVTTGYADLSC